MQTPVSHGTFIAEVTSPDPQRFYLSHIGVERSSFGSFDWLGWELVANKLSSTGEELAFTDHWEETLLEILRYPENYVDKPLNWRRERSGEPADMLSLQPAFDASRRFDTAIKTRLSPDGTQRLCFNLYDDGCYRFTLEELIREGPLFAWVPRSWSTDWPKMSSAEEAARKAFGWFE